MIHAGYEGNDYCRKILISIPFLCLVHPKVKNLSFYQGNKHKSLKSTKKTKQINFSTLIKCIIII